jgi:glyoxylase-like metal-dependent hydrolase (beta-lactamase superfamily II)
MSKTARRVAVGAVVLLLTPVVIGGGLLAWTFRGLAPAEDGAELPGGARLVRAGVSNVYVLSTGTGAALIDCGNDREGRAIQAELTRRGLGADSVEAIFLTHGHRDHLAACDRFPKARVYAMADEAPIIEGDAVSRGPVPRWRAPAKDLGVRVSDRLQDGQVVTVGTLSVAGFQLRGHTDGSAAYLSSEVLYVGDSAFVEADGSLRGAAFLFSDDAEESWRSLRQVAANLVASGERIRAVATGHSGPSGEAAFPALASSAH